MKLSHVLSLAIVCVFLMGSQCGTPKPDPVIPTDTDDCPAACDHMRKMPVSKESTKIGCEIAEDLEDGTPCEIFCVDFQTQGIPLQPSCILKQNYCDEIEPNCFHHP